MMRSASLERWSLVMGPLGLALVAGCDGGGSGQDGWSGNDNGVVNDNGTGAPTHPDVESTVPVDGATDVSRDAEISITFARAIDPDRVAEAKYAVDPGFESDVFISDDGRTVTMTPVTPLGPGTTYTVTITELRFADGSGLTAPFSFAFKTAGNGTGTGGIPQSGTPTCLIFPPDNPWNTDISDYPVHSRSDVYIESIGRDETLHPDFGTVWQGDPIGIPYVIVSGDQPKVPVTFEYADESDPGPYPIPPDAPIESGSDLHVLVIDDDNCLLYETFDSHPVNGGESWTAGSGAIFDLTSNKLRPDYWTSADAAGLPIFPGLVRYDEVMEKREITHALRFTVEQTQAGFIHPATHFASESMDPNLPPMGLRLRMKASYDCSAYSDEVQVICDCLKIYGMFVADNGGNWFITGAPDSRWNDENLAELRNIPGDAFEAVDTGQIIR